MRSRARMRACATGSSAWKNASAGCRTVMANLARLTGFLYGALRFRLYRFIPRFARDPDPERAQRLREALETLGPIFVKFGQLLSTRRDLLPADLADELAKLQDRVPPFAAELAVAEVESSLGRKLDQVFSSFEKEAVASASVAQVHLAVLKDVAEVALKVRPPVVA